MLNDFSRKISQCHNALKNQGFCLTTFPLPNELLTYVKERNFSEIDKIFKKLLRNDGPLFHFLAQFTPDEIEFIEFIISLRESKNEWEEDGIWHDDGSRVLAFSLSLTLDEIKGGILEIRKKGELHTSEIPTPKYGDGIIFKTGHESFEHKINKVTDGSRLIIAGWLYQDPQISPA